ncbi:neutral zinc metallopeptidase [Kribbella sp. NBC_01484]|uniref:neutral zinc metallopeptidase n=1 Tax=Kribbella sp. NBC_01484 TaxID=2903579 RepID=UPI002E2EA6E6|nr:neutral zinc metallopeptidase [Kribbella sp. NBC_01484]
METEQVLRRNQLYDGGQAAAVRCPRSSARLATKQAVMRYASSIVGCLTRSWTPAVERAGFKLFPVNAVHAAPRGTPSPCGPMDTDTVAFYCDDDRGIYLDWTQYIAKSADSQESSRVAVEYTMAHEYGHHLQATSGMSSAYDDRFFAAKSETARVAESRRNELQASCFAAAFFGANQKTLQVYGERLEDYEYHAFSGDDADAPATERGYGSPKTNRTWARAAFKAEGPGACNTWAAPAKQVS